MSMNSDNLENMNEIDECCSSESERKSHHSDKVKNNLVTRLNRIEGQIRGIKGLIEKDTYCDDVITQISATQSALNSVGRILLEGHMKTCVLEKIQEGDTEILDEVMVTIQKLMKK
ncbi:metal-sensitive transcriptional regulator [Bacillus sp. IB182487]|uniref:Metal-sensitive transcriptional regulator n=2 Tax=Metabacillus arenae TaxID=2771434 RepID=A0A926NFS9_9BACI|nr:metal-sensitive transcriptional regulator [Metabacillus arenae]MBD1380471.1 metal-sensitive transcriptional regulator [Metabacillus arenae]